MGLFKNFFSDNNDNQGKIISNVDVKKCTLLGEDKNYKYYSYEVDSKYKLIKRDLSTNKCYLLGELGNPSVYYHNWVFTDLAITRLFHVIMAIDTISTKKKSFPLFIPVKWGFKSVHLEQPVDALEKMFVAEDDNLHLQFRRMSTNDDEVYYLPVYDEGYRFIGINNSQIIGFEYSIHEENGQFSLTLVNTTQRVEKPAANVNNKVWINPQTNKIECRGDNCPQKSCDETCPIWLNTLASRAYASKDYDKTIEYLNKAVSIEPAFKDAWNNMGACYGFIGKYKESLDAYLKAVEIDPNYRNPYYGIVLNYKNMEDYQTAIEWCEKYRDRFHNDFLDEQYKECKQLLASQKETNVEEKGGPVEESIGTGGIIDQKQFEDAYGRIAAVLANEATFDKGYDELEKLANEGCLEAIVLVGQLSHGNDDELAMKCFQKAADAGMSEGYWGLSGYIRHNFVPDLSNPDDLKWVNCVKKAAELGCHDAMNELGNIYNRLGQFQHCMYWYLMADHNEHEQGKIGAKGVSQKWKASGYPMDTFKDLSEAKIEDATIIMRYYAGDCDAKTLVKSLEEVALKDGHALAAVWIGKVYENKEMLGMSYRFYNIAAMEGDANANRILGDLYMSGRGVRQSVQEAYNHYLEAAEAGQRHACFVIGEFERNAGRKEKANAWYMKAYVRGYTEAIHRVIKLQS